jgi:hypothetical protein
MLFPGPATSSRCLRLVLAIQNGVASGSRCVDPPNSQCSDHGRGSAYRRATNRFATRCPGQQPETQDHDAALTPEQWKQRVEEARRRSEEFVARTRTQTEDPVSAQKEQAEAQDQRALNDPTLMPGDIVATSKGFVVFVGRAEQHQSSDFRSYSRSALPAVAPFAYRHLADRRTAARSRLRQNSRCHAV